jgi:hypothetical protein
MVGLALLLAGSAIGSWRAGNTGMLIGAPLQFVAEQGMSLHVTEVAVAEQQHFAPHIFSYLGSELLNAFVAADQDHYVPGKRFADDVSVYLNPMAYRLGFGSGSTYLAEAYVLGGLGGVILISLMLGILLQGLHLCSRNAVGLFLAGLVLPDVLWMTRAGLLDWVSGLLRVAVSISLLIAGWCLYRLLAGMGSVLLTKAAIEP